jgi:hypothetical protein
VSGMHSKRNPNCSWCDFDRRADRIRREEISCAIQREK